MPKEIKDKKCKVSPQYGKDNNKNLHFYCENCGREMEYDEIRTCEAKQPKEIREFRSGANIIIVETAV